MSTFHPRVGSSAAVLVLPMFRLGPFQKNTFFFHYFPWWDFTRKFGLKKSSFHTIFKHVIPTFNEKKDALILWLCCECVRTEFFVNGSNKTVVLYYMVILAPRLRKSCFERNFHIGFFFIASILLRREKSRIPNSIRLHFWPSGIFGPSRFC